MFRSHSSLLCSNNTNKLSPQEQWVIVVMLVFCSNNTNKLSPQEPVSQTYWIVECSNNTNKLSPQEPLSTILKELFVQIIQINLALKNSALIVELD